MHPPTLSKTCLAFHLTPSLLSTQTSKAMLLHIQEHKEITCKEAKPLAMTLQRAETGLEKGRVGRALERKPTAVCVDAYLN